MRGLAALFLIVAYLIPAVLFAIPVYGVIALFHGDLGIVPSDRSDLYVFFAIGGIFYAYSLVTAPGRLASQ